MMDNLSVQIRYGLISKKQAIAIVEKNGVFIPHDDIELFCNFINEDVSWFWETLEKFRNKKIWKKEKGIWCIPNFIVKNFNWEILNKYANS